MIITVVPILVLGLSLARGSTTPFHRHESRSIHQPPSERAVSFNYGTQKVRGVNLGGWLVTEPWITPSIYKYGNAVVDEWTLGKHLGRSATEKVLKAHWDSWITEADFAAIAAAGLNHVRIPIGYWAYDISAGEPYVQGQRPYMKKALTWASKHGIRVLIDIHGAPGSQNGFDNSGHRGKIAWQTTSSNIKRTYSVHKSLVNEFGGNAALAGIEALNEPAGFVDDGGKMISTIQSFYTEAYAVTRKKSSSALFVFHDAFLGLGYWSNFMRAPKYQNVAIDTHIYGVFTPELNAMSFADRVSYYCDMKGDVAASNAKTWTYTGEWSPATTDCAPRLNGQDKGARYDGTFPGSYKIGSCSGKSGLGSKFSSSYKVQLRKMFEVQTTVYEQGQGWFMWAWKAEKADDWSYQAGLKYGWIPSDPTAKKYGNQC